MWKLALRNLRSNLTRLVATAIAVIAGTAFVSTGLVLTEAVGNAVAGNVEAEYGAVDVAVVPAQTDSLVAGVPAEVLDEVRALPEVAGAAGELVESTKILDDEGDSLRSQMLGRSWIEDDELNPFTVVEGRAPEAAGEVAVDRGTSEDHGVAVGDEVRLATPAGPDTATVVGVTTFGRSDAVDGGGTIFFAADAALDVLGADSDAWGQILVRGDGVDEDRLVTSVADVAPATASVVSGSEFREQQVEATQAFLDFIRPLLLGFAFLALFVAAFVIYNTFSVVVTQRTRELALVRSIGATPSQVRRSLIAEGLVLGVVASAVGLVVGLALSLLVQWLLDRFDAPLPSAGFALTPWIVFLTIVSGTLATVVAVFVPAFRAGRTKPVEAMRTAEIDRSGTSTARLVVGAVLLGLGLVLAISNRLVFDQGVLLGVATLLLFLGVIVGGPLLARLFGRGLHRLFGRSLTLRLATDNLARNPKRTSTTANALVIGLFLVTLVTVAGTAFRDWAMAEVADLSSSDYMIVGITPVPDDILRAVQDTPGVEAAAAVRMAQVTDINGDTVLLSGADIDELRATAGLEATAGSLDAVAAGQGAAVIDQLSPPATRSGGGTSSPSTTSASETTTTAPAPTTPSTTEGGNLQIEPSGPNASVGGGSSAVVGDVYVFEGPDGEEIEVPVAASLEINLDVVFLMTLVDEALFEQVAGDQPVAQVFIRADPDEVDQVGNRLDGLLRDYTGLTVEPGNFIGQLLGDIIDFFIAAVNGLLALSVLIALIGIVNTMNLSIHERRRELGMVRALGMTNTQVRSMVRVEAFLIGVLGTLIGVGSGILVGWLVVSSVTEGGIGLAWGRVGLIVAAGVVISVLASLLPARRAVRVPMLDAMAAT